MTQHDDDLAIRNRYAAYCFAADDRDPAAIADCFTEGALVEVVGQSRLVGRAAIARVQETSSRRRHLTFNVWIHLLQGDVAAARAYFVTMDHTGTTAGHGRYTDDLVREPDGVWRFQRRLISYDWQSPDYHAWVRQVVDRANAAPPDVDADTGRFQVSRPPSTGITTPLL